MVINKNWLYILLIFVFLHTSYLYLFRFLETLFWAYNLNPSLIDSEGLASYEAYKKVAPGKKVFFFIQLAQGVLLFIYTKRLKKENKLPPIGLVMYYTIAVCLILYLIIGLLGAIAPHSGIAG
jgi:hypothetical protein